MLGVLYVLQGYSAHCIGLQNLDALIHTNYVRKLPCVTTNERLIQLCGLKLLNLIHLSSVTRHNFCSLLSSRPVMQGVINWFGCGRTQTFKPHHGHVVAVEW
jgi:hypothetical protein